MQCSCLIPNDLTEEKLINLSQFEWFCLNVRIVTALSGRFVILIQLNYCFHFRIIYYVHTCVEKIYKMLIYFSSITVSYI
jgi:hypothetical protein